ncbi:hypothetical protein OAQ71_00105 [bacterium]|nr:hypothetical protein [bacterium]
MPVWRLPVQCYQRKQGARGDEGVREQLGQYPLPQAGLIDIPSHSATSDFDLLDSEFLLDYGSEVPIVALMELCEFTSKRHRVVFDRNDLLLDETRVICQIATRAKRREYGTDANTPQFRTSK